MVDMIGIEERDQHIHIEQGSHLTWGLREIQ